MTVQRKSETNNTMYTYLINDKLLLTISGFSNVVNCQQKVD